MYKERHTFNMKDLMVMLCMPFYLTQFPAFLSAVQYNYFHNTLCYCANKLQINVVEPDGFDQYFLNGTIVTISKYIHPYT